MSYQGGAADRLHDARNKTLDEVIVWHTAEAKRCDKAADAAVKQLHHVIEKNLIAQAAEVRRLRTRAQLHYEAAGHFGALKIRTVGEPS